MSVGGRAWHHVISSTGGQERDEPCETGTFYTIAGYSMTMTTMAPDNLDDGSSGRASTRTSVTVIVPTYHEVASIPHLVARLQSVRAAANLDLDWS